MGSLQRRRFFFAFFLTAAGQLCAWAAEAAALGSSTKATLPSLACSEDEFQCAPGTACFPLVWRCDGHADCVDEQDEQNCGLDLAEASVAAKPDVFNRTACSFPCGNGGEVPLGMRCDGKPDCRDSSDESGCGSGNVSCAPDEWQCGIGGPCLPLERLCDCYLECPDSSVELAKDCKLQAAKTKATLPSLACSKDEFQCAPGSACFPLAWRCDGHADCVDEQDEQNCGLDLPESSVAAKPENKTFPAKDLRGILKDPVYLAAIAIVALLIATAAGVGVALWECRKKRSSSSYKLADRFTV